MKLYKNVDIKDLDSILKQGILSLDASNNNNWEDGKRVSNATNEVYLFKPVTERNSFTNYGLALLEVEVSTANLVANELSITDANVGLYEEYITDYVAAENIKNIYLPKMFKERVQQLISADIFNMIKFVEIEAKAYSDGELQSAKPEQLDFVARTAQLNTTEFNFFRGAEEYVEVVDLYEVIYKI